MVSDSLVRRVSRSLTAPFSVWFAITCVMTSVLPATAIAQQSSADTQNGFSDFEAPIIEHTASNGGKLGSIEVFGATVVDNDAIENVTLFYRFSGETEFAELGMREIASSSFYSAKVDTANVPSSTDSIEYYLQAEDVSGNLVLKGFAFQPLVRFFEQVLPDVAPVPVEPVTEAAKPGVNWLYVGLGVLAAGAIAAAAGGSGGGGGASADDPDATCPDGCDVTVTFGRP